jgi:hypothetical protein
MRVRIRAPAGLNWRSPIAGDIAVSQYQGPARVELGSAEAVGLRLVTEGRFENLSEACRAGLCRLAHDARVVDCPVSLAEEGLRSGIADGFDIDASVAEMPVAR